MTNPSNHRAGVQTARICSFRALQSLVFVHLVVSAACRAPSATLEPLASNYSLSSVNGLPLPYDDGAVPPRPGIDATCRILLVGGRLAIDNSALAYLLTYDLQESCTGRMLGTSGSAGTFSRKGSTITLVGDLGEGKTETRIAELRGNALNVDYVSYRFGFVR